MAQENQSCAKDIANLMTAIQASLTNCAGKEEKNAYPG